MTDIFPTYTSHAKPINLYLSTSQNNSNTTGGTPLRPVTEGANNSGYLPEVESSNDNYSQRYVCVLTATHAKELVCMLCVSGVNQSCLLFAFISQHESNLLQVIQLTSTLFSQLSQTQDFRPQWQQVRLLLPAQPHVLLAPQAAHPLRLAHHQRHTPQSWRQWRGRW